MRVGHREGYIENDYDINCLGEHVKTLGMMQAKGACEAYWEKKIEK